MSEATCGGHSLEAIPVSLPLIRLRLPAGTGHSLFEYRPLFFQKGIAMPDLPGFDVLLLNEDETPMEFVVLVWERIFDMSNLEAIPHMLRIHDEGVAICGTYRRDEAERKVADVLAFARAHKHGGDPEMLPPSPCRPGTSS
jgi:ATP-dependent Clp protease adaptor protein ClpS